MPQLTPMRAVRFTPAAGEPADLLAPPYDVIDESMAAELRARSPHNAVHLVLPEGDMPGRYEEAAARLERWLAEGVLAEDTSPAVYLYRQSFVWNGRSLERRSFFAALELTPFERGKVLAHEHTHRGPKRDRLALTLACRAQLSAVFLVAEDRADELATTLERAERAAGPVLEAETPDGIGHRVWRVEETALAERICNLAGAHPLLMADGHHRYETALAAREALPDEEAAGWVLACVASESDPGVMVLPTHRSLRSGAGEAGWRTALESWFELEPLAEDNPAAVAARVERHGRGSLGAIAGTGDAFLLRPRPEGLRKLGLGDAEARIASVLFDRLVLEGVLRTDADAAAAAGILAYHKDADEAVATAGSAGAAFLLPSVEVAAVRAAVESYGRLPAKSTYFAPKIPSGVLFRRLNGGKAAL